MHIMNAPTCPSNSWAISRLRESIASLAPLSTSVLITQIRSLSERLPIEDINRKRPIALFICLTTKALYLKLVSDYTSPTFIAAYQRFVSRRGPMHSDNGTTFYDTNRELHMRKQFAILISEIDSQTELRGISYPPCTTALRRSVGGRC